MPNQVRIKICGITRTEDLLQTIDAGADAIGLNFHPPSPRFIPEETAHTFLSLVPPFVETVGVFVKKSPSELFPLLQRLGRLRAFQIHGGTPEIFDSWPCYYIPAFQVRDECDLLQIKAYLDRAREANCVPSAILVDGHAPGLEGGTGQRAPWDLLVGFQPGTRLILAGGLTPENVAEAVERIRPWAVDVASGVESSPGIKDPVKVRRFIEAARSV